MYGLKTEASFDSAHFLTDYYGKCGEPARPPVESGGVPRGRRPASRRHDEGHGG
ncbi:MAG: hypothetical protein ACLSVD_00545 [Eggerthellaceae bacterium]